MVMQERQYQPGERVPGTEYVVVRLEAQGGHGALYLVRHHFLEKKIQMLKTLRAFEPNAELIERLKREAQMLAGMEHPHIVSVTSGGLTDEKHPRPYFVMERLKGRSLAQIIPAAPEGVGVDAALKVTIEVCDALEYVHVKHGVVHRDIKPDNVFLHVTPRNGSVTKILDFGVAHIMDLEKRYTKNNLFLGTPRYASPEQILGEKPTPQTDLYAVGLLLYELLLGRGPFDRAKSFKEAVDAHVKQEPPTFPTSRRFPDGLEEVVLSLLRKKAAERPKSAEWLASRLRQIERSAELEEHAEAQNLVQTAASPVQNMLAGHRAQLTDAGATPEIASEPTVSDPSNPDADDAMLAYRSTVRVATPEGSIRRVDRAAPTRTLQADLPTPRRSDTEELPDARAWLPSGDPDQSESPSSREPETPTHEGTSTTNGGGATTTTSALRRYRVPVIVGVAAGLGLASVGAALYARSGDARSGSADRLDLAAIPTATAAATATATTSASATAIPLPTAIATVTTTASSTPTPTTTSAPTSTTNAPPRSTVAPTPRPTPAAKTKPLVVPSSGL